MTTRQVLTVQYINGAIDWKSYTTSITDYILSVSLTDVDKNAMLVFAELYEQFRNVLSIIQTEIDICRLNEALRVYSRLKTTLERTIPLIEWTAQDCGVVAPLVTEYNVMKDFFARYETKLKKRRRWWNFTFKAK